MLHKVLHVVNMNIQYINIAYISLLILNPKSNSKSLFAIFFLCLIIKVDKSWIALNMRLIHVPEYIRAFMLMSWLPCTLRKPEYAWLIHGNLHSWLDHGVYLILNCHWIDSMIHGYSVGVPPELFLEWRLETTTKFKCYDFVLLQLPSFQDVK